MLADGRATGFALPWVSFLFKAILSHDSGFSLSLRGAFNQAISCMRIYLESFKASGPGFSSS